MTWLVKNVLPVVANLDARESNRVEEWREKMRSMAIQEPKASIPARRPFSPRIAHWIRGSLATKGTPMEVPMETPHQPTGPWPTKSSVCTASSVAFHSGTAFCMRAVISCARSGLYSRLREVIRAVSASRAAAVASGVVRSPWPGASMATTA